VILSRILHLFDKSTTIDSPINSLTGSVSMLFQLTRNGFERLHEGGSPEYNDDCHVFEAGPDSTS
jgi:hypothetical protein